MEWEAGLIEWLQANVNCSGTFAKVLAFLGAEAGLLIAVLIVGFCWKKENSSPPVLYTFTKINKEIFPKINDYFKVLN